MKKYTHLIKTLGFFSEEAGLSNDQIFGLLHKSVINKYIDIEILKKEFLLALSDKNLNWISISEDSQLLLQSNIYSNQEVKNYIKFWLWEYLFPEKKLSQEIIDRLSNKVIEILKQQTIDNSWLFSYDLYSKLLNQEEWKDLEYYNLWKIDFSNIERKLENNEKDREIGFLRYKR